MSVESFISLITSVWVIISNRSVFINSTKDPTFIAHVMGGITWALASNTTKAFSSSATVGNPAATNSTSASSNSLSNNSDSNSSSSVGTVT